MIPFLTYKKAVDRLVKASRSLGTATNKDEQTGHDFEYRDAKRALYDLGKLLITGEVPNRSMK